MTVLDAEMVPREAEALVARAGMMV